MSIPYARPAIVVRLLFLDDFFAVTDLFGIATAFEVLIDTGLS